MKRILAMCTIVCFCIAPVMAGPKGYDCAGCKEVKAKGDGWCDHCKKGMVDWLSVKSENLYKAMENSSYQMVLAKGETVKPSTIKCANCKKMAETHQDGYCKKCDGGMVAGRCFKGKAAYDKADEAYKVLKMASKAKCDGCAVAMATDGKCDHCKVAYKAGKMVKIKG